MRHLARHVACLRRRARLGCTLSAGCVSAALIAPVTRVLAADDVLTPFGVHALRHATVLGLLLLAGALVTVAILRSASR